MERQKAPEAWERAMVKTDPILGYRALGPGLIIVGILWLGAEIVNGFKYPVLLIGAPVLFLIAFAVSRFFLHWVRIEMRRQRAVLPEQLSVPFAHEQPGWDETALSLPYTIKHRPSWDIPLACFVVLASLTSAGLLLFVYSVNSGPPLPGFVALFLVSCSLIFSASIASLFPLMGSQSIKVTEKELQVRRTRTDRIKWEDVRLFAIYPARKHSNLPIWYELSGKTAIARWRRMRPGAFSRFSKAPVSFDEYDRQMEALLALIAAKTGLALYDLR